MFIDYSMGLYYICEYICNRNDWKVFYLSWKTMYSETNNKKSYMSFIQDLSDIIVYHHMRRRASSLHSTELLLERMNK